MRVQRRIPSSLRHPATLIAIVALIVATGIGEDAAARITATLTGANIKNETLTGIDVRNSTITSADVRNGSLLSTDFKAGQLPAGPAGPDGPTGPQGPKGDKGDPGVVAFNDVTFVPAGADAAANGAAVRAAIAAATPPASGRAVVQLDAGTYSIGTTSLALAEDVDLVGAGRDATVITGQSGFGVVTGASNSTVSDLTIESIASSGSIIGFNAAGGTLERVRVRVAGSGTVTGVSGVFALSGVTLRDTIVSATRNTGTVHAVQLSNATAIIERSELSASGGTTKFAVRLLTAGSATISHSIVTSGTLEELAGTMHVELSRIPTGSAGVGVTLALSACGTVACP